MAEGLITPEQLRRIAEEKEMAQLREALEKKRRADEAQHGIREAFMAREIQPEVFDRLSRVVKAAAERGEREVLVLRSSSGTAPMAAARSTAWKPTGRRL